MSNITDATIEGECDKLTLEYKINESPLYKDNITGSLSKLAVSLKKLKDDLVSKKLKQSIPEEEVFNDVILNATEKAIETKKVPELILLKDEIERVALIYGLEYQLLDEEFLRSKNAAKKTALGKQRDYLFNKVKIFEDYFYLISKHINYEETVVDKIELIEKNKEQKLTDEENLRKLIDERTSKFSEIDTRVVSKLITPAYADELKKEYDLKIYRLENADVIKQYDNSIYNISLDEQKDRIKDLLKERFADYRDTLLDVNFLDSSWAKRHSSSVFTDYNYRDVMLKAAKLENYKVDLSGSLTENGETLETQLKLVKQDDVYKAFEFKLGIGMGDFGKSDFLTANNRGANTTIINTENNKKNFHQLLIECEPPPAPPLTLAEYLKLLESDVKLFEDNNKYLLETIDRLFDAGKNSFIGKDCDLNGEYLNTSEQGELDSAFLTAFSNYKDEETNRNAVIKQYEGLKRVIAGDLRLYHEAKIDLEASILAYDTILLDKDDKLRRDLKEKIRNKGLTQAEMEAAENEVNGLGLSGSFNPAKLAELAKYRLANLTLGSVASGAFSILLYPFKKLYGVIVATKNEIVEQYKTDDTARGKIRLEALAKRIEKETDIFNTIRDLNLKNDITQFKILKSLLPSDIPTTDLDFTISQMESEVLKPTPEKYTTPKKKAETKELHVNLPGEGESEGTVKKTFAFKMGGGVYKAKTAAEIGDFKMLAKMACEKSYNEYIKKETEAVIQFNDLVPRFGMELRTDYEERIDTYFTEPLTPNQKELKNNAIICLVRFPVFYDTRSFSINQCAALGVPLNENARRMIDSGAEWGTTRVLVPSFETFLNCMLI